MTTIGHPARRRARRLTAAPLAGVRIVSLAQNLPGPLVVSRLVAAGASATKVEPPGGDPMARYSRRWYRELHRNVAVVSLDLKSVPGRQALDERLAAAEMLITSQRPSALARLGLGWRPLSRRHPHLRVVAIVGDTRTPEEPGHDLTYQAAAGLVGDTVPRTLLADILGADEATIAALLLLRQPAPARAVVGLCDALAVAARPWQLGLTRPDGLLGGGRPAYAVYETRRGRVAVAALEPHFEARFYEALGLEPGADPSEALRQRTARQWHRRATRIGLPLVALPED